MPGMQYLPVTPLPNYPLTYSSELIPITPLESFIMAAKEAAREGPAFALDRLLEAQRLGPMGASEEEFYAAEDQEQYIPKEAAEKMIKDMGLDPGEFDLTSPYINKQRLEWGMQNRKQQLDAQRIIARNADSLVGMTGIFAASMLGSMFDPAGLLANFIPVGGIATGAARATAVATRGYQRAIGLRQIQQQAFSAMRRSAGMRPQILRPAADRTIMQDVMYAGADGAIGNAMTDWVALLSAQSDQREFNFDDYLQSIAFGGIIGGGLTAGTGAITRAYNAISDGRAPNYLQAAERAQPEGSIAEGVQSLDKDLQIAVGESALADAANGRNVDVELVLAESGLDPLLRPMVRSIDNKGGFKVGWRKYRDIEHFTREMTKIGVRLKDAEGAYSRAGERWLSEGDAYSAAVRELDLAKRELRIHGITEEEIARYMETLNERPATPELALADMMLQRQGVDMRDAAQLQAYLGMQTPIRDAATYLREKGVIEPGKRVSAKMLAGKPARAALREGGYLKKGERISAEDLFIFVSESDEGVFPWLDFDTIATLDQGIRSGQFKPLGPGAAQRLNGKASRPEELREKVEAHNAPENDFDYNKPQQDQLSALDQTEVPELEARLRELEALAARVQDPVARTAISPAAAAVAKENAATYREALQALNICRQEGQS